MMYNTTYKYNLLFGNNLYTKLIKTAIYRPYEYPFDMKEINEKSEKALKDDSYLSMVKYNSGYCKYNHLKSNGIEMNDRDKKIYNDIQTAYDKVEPLSYPINLFHGFELGMKYPKFEKNNVIQFDFILSKTPSWQVANFFASHNCNLINKYMYILYPPNTKHLSIDIRLNFNNEYEYLAINEKLRYIDKVYHLSLWPLSLNIYLIMFNL